MRKVSIQERNLHTAIQDFLIPIMQTLTQSPRRLFVDPAHFPTPHLTINVLRAVQIDKMRLLQNAQTAMSTGTIRVVAVGARQLDVVIVGVAVLHCGQ